MLIPDWLIRMLTGDKQETAINIAKSCRLHTGKYSCLIGCNSSILISDWSTDGLETEDEVEEHFPVSVTYSDYLNSSSSVRDRRSRIIQLRIKIDSLPLDEHARDKFIRLVGDRSIIFQ